jgi:hypothetical protein
MVNCYSYQYLFFQEGLLSGNATASHEVFVCSGISKVKRSKGQSRICVISYVILICH